MQTPSKEGETEAGSDLQASLYLTVRNQAPHHSLRSWRMYLYKTRPYRAIGRKRHETVQTPPSSDEQYPEDEEASEWSSEGASSRGLDDNDACPSETDVNSRSSVSLDYSGDAEEDAKRFDLPGRPLRPPELRTLARFIASAPDWSETDLAENMQRFQSKVKQHVVSLPRAHSSPPVSNST